MRKLKSVIFSVWVLLPAGILFIFLVINHIFPLRNEPSYSQIISDKDGEILNAFLTPDEKWRMYADNAEISKALKKTIIFKEDRYFYFHPGINPVAICRALFNNTIKNKKTSGASTITMQVARLLYPNKRTYYNKLTEIFRSFQIEWKYNKNEILQLYLNLVPYGGNIEGIKSASFFYFGINPSKLNLSQSVILSIIPNRPNSLNPRKGKLLIIREKNRWLQKLQSEKVWSEKEIADALSENDKMEKTNVPKQVPHLSIRLRKIFSKTNIITSTIDSKIQAKAENVAYNHYQRLSLKNIHNLSVIIVENTTRKVRGYIGSPNFNDLNNAGQVDGCNAIRSPGSTLKPLLYAMAIEKGLITPAKMVEDVPVNFSGYAPENFNSHCNGLVTAAKALAFSLNIPAVALLNELGLNEFTSQLKKSGFSAIKSNSEMGLSVILGGCGVKATELVAMYTAFANNGYYAPLNYSENDTITNSTMMVSEAAAFMVTEMLTGLNRPDLPNNYESSMHIPKIAWKTGTSYGRRDAWSIGYNNKYTMLVWVGNFNGVGVPELTGADMATPLLFDLFNTIDYNSENRWYVAPKSVDYRMVCSASGLPPDEYCTNFITDVFIPGVSENRKCTHLKEVMISPDKSYAFCMQCVPETGYKKELFENFSPAINSFYEANGIEYRKAPPHNPYCTRLFTDNAPMIISPINNKEYLLEKNAAQQIKLACNAEAEISSIYWYVNDVFIKKSSPDSSVFFTPMEGAYKISCSDDKGRNTNLRITVKYY